MSNTLEERNFTIKKNNLKQNLPSMATAMYILCRTYLAERQPTPGDVVDASKV